MSILKDVKIDIGDSEENTDFDDIIVRHINTAFGILSQLGVGPKNGFKITGYNEDWKDYLGDTTDYKQLEMVRTYISKKVQLMFDPPQNATYMNALKDTASELEWRLNVAVDPKEWE